MVILFRYIFVIIAFAICLSRSAGREIGGSETCEQHTKDKEQCLQTSENGEPCAYCTSASVGTLCAPESDTEGLPPSVFACETQLKDDVYSCTQYDDDKEKCLESTSNGIPCAYCRYRGTNGNSFYSVIDLILLSIPGLRLPCLICIDYRCVTEGYTLMKCEHQVTNSYNTTE